VSERKASLPRNSCCGSRAKKIEQVLRALVNSAQGESSFGSRYPQTSHATLRRESPKNGPHCEGGLHRQGPGFLGGTSRT